MIIVDRFNPVAFSIFSFDVRWYAIAYLVGFFVAFFYVRILDKERLLSPRHIESLLYYIVIGVIFGGRIGYILIYDFKYYISYPVEIFKVWHGGMSFHGGLIGCIISIYVFSRVEKLNILYVLDLCACSGPFGLFLGRIANFINGELYGRETNVPWGVKLVGADVVRHPSQIYESLGEGLFLWIFLYLIASKTDARKMRGLLTSIMLFWYSIVRFCLEFFREPDVQIGYIWKYFTMGQVISVVMFLLTGLFYVCITRLDNRGSRV